MLLRLVREGLGTVLVAADWVTRPSQVKRSEAEQTKVVQQLQGVSLYQFRACPFCIKVRRAMHRLNLPIELRDVNRNQQYRQELQANAGKVMVPCLRIDSETGSQWMQESGDIIAYLEQRFG